MALLLTKWELSWTDRENLSVLRAGTLHEPIPVTVPHNVQQAFFDNKTQLFYGQNLESIRWTEDKAWIYRTAWQQEKQAGKHYLLTFHGFDYHGEIYLNGSLLRCHTGMFGSVQIDITEQLLDGENNLWVVFWLEEDMLQRSTRHYGLKCQNSYEWDAAPRMLTMGLWDDVLLEEKESSWISNYHITSTAEGFVTVQLERKGTLAAANATVSFGATCHHFSLQAEEQSTLAFKIENPKLWYPHDLGEPFCYDVTLLLEDTEGNLLDKIQTRHGIRDLTMTCCTEEHNDHTPLQININGEKVFIKGVNMVPLDVFPASLNQKRYEDYLTVVRDAGVNLIRIWGGGLLEKDIFYQLCDELGILVWQDFPLACEKPLTDPAYLSLIEDQTRRMVLRLRNHSSVVLYCGGNELYVDWSRLKNAGPEADALAKELEHLIEPFDWDTYMAGAAQYQESALQLMGRICHELDRTRPYHISSPLEGEGEVHGPWGYDLKHGDHRYRIFPGSFYEFWNTFKAELYSEAGCSGMANEAQYRAIIPEAEQWPISAESANLRYHKAFGAAWGREDQWLDLEMLKKYFGPVGSLADMIWASQFLQAEGVRYLLEECRRKQPACCGAMVWAVNETWPNAASLSVLDHDLSPKAAYYAMKKAFAPISASLRYQDLFYHGSAMHSELWTQLPAGTKASLQWSFRRLDGSVIQEGHCIADGQDGLPHCQLKLAVPAAKEALILAELTLHTEKEDFRNQYFFANAKADAPFGELLKNTTLREEYDHVFR